MRGTEGLVFAHTATIRGVLRSRSVNQLAGDFNIPNDDLELLMGPVMWITGATRSRVRKTLESFIFGALDALGLPRFEVTAEWIAQWIVATIAPINWMSACAIWDRPRLAEALAVDDGRQVDYETITAARLHAIVHQLASEDAWCKHMAEERAYNEQHRVLNRDDGKSEKA